MNKKTLFLTLLIWPYAGHVYAQVELADSAWTTTSTEQVLKTEFNGDLVDGLDNVSITYQAGVMTFTNHSDPSKSFSLAVKYDKTELGVVYFEPEDPSFVRVTLQVQSKTLVVERTDLAMTAYAYTAIEIE